MSEMLRDEEVQISIPPASIFPGFRFSPTDEELISYYLNKKLEGSQKCVDVISEVEINKYEPWDLPAKSVIQSENEWFFFSPRGRKYPNGSQSKRATESGYWKATGKERNVKSGSNVIGTKRTLVFHVGRAPKGERTEWIMHEYSMSGRSPDSLVICRLRRNSDFRLNDSPRQSSSSQRHFPTENNGHFNLSEIGVEHSGLVEGAKAVECCSKDGSSSYNSHSVEQQVDSGYEHDQKLMNEFSQLGSSSHQDHDYEECYADILKDDIVDLGKPLLTPNHDLLPPFADQRKRQEPVLASPLSFVPPLQGTANRRIKLSWQILENNQTEQVEIEPRNEDRVEELMPPNKGHPRSTFVFSFLSHQNLGRRYMYIVFGVLSVLVLFASMWDVPCQVKRFMRIS